MAGAVKRWKADLSADLGGDLTRAQQTLVELAAQTWVVVAAPLPNRAPRPGTEEECQMRAWFSTATMPRPAVKSFLIR